MTPEGQKEEPNPPTLLPEKAGGDESEPLAASPEASEGAPAKPQAAPAPSPKGYRRRKLALVAAVAAVAFGIWYLAIRTPEPRDDQGRFQGVWRVAVPAETREKMPAAKLKQGITIRVSGDRWAYRFGEQEQKKFTMVLRPEASPKEIDLTLLAPDDKPVIQKWPPPARPVVIRGIYTVERGQARIVAAPGDEPRPTDINATDGVTVWILERVQ